MSIRRQYEQRYAAFWRSLANFLRNSSGFKVSGVARQGSRNIGTHRDRSDLDVKGKLHNHFTFGVNF